MRAYLWAKPHRLGLLLEATGCGACRVGCFSKAGLSVSLFYGGKFLHKRQVSLIVLGRSLTLMSDWIALCNAKQTKKIRQRWLELAAWVMRLLRIRCSELHPSIFPPIRRWQTLISHFGFLFSFPEKSMTKKKSKWHNSSHWTSPWSVYFATRPHEVHTGSTQMRLSLEKVIGWRLQWQGFPLRDEYTIGPRGACWKRAFSLQVAPCGNSISGVVGGPQLGLSVGV